MSKARKRFDFQPYLRREPVTLALLSGLAIILFAAVAGVSRLHDEQQNALAARWSTRGQTDLNAKRYSAAVVDFRTSLLYSRDNYAYQLSLAQALMGDNRIDEAYAYLINLWDRQPENGLVNLELARIAAGRGQTESALRYYHNAIYAVWPGKQNVERRKTRLELIHLLLHIGDKAQADSELIALAANLDDKPEEHAQAGQLFFQAQDYQRALAQFRLTLRHDRRNAKAMAGAGNAAFKLGQYAVAERYLREAVEHGDKASAAQLKLTQVVLSMDPFRSQVTSAQRRQIVVKAFAAAGARLKTCSTPGAFAVPAATLANLTQGWNKLKPRITLWELRRNPDLVNTAMATVFNIERKTSGMCGGSTNTDDALLLIANLHEGL